jgi:hypothetical protein
VLFVPFCGYIIDWFLILFENWNLFGPILRSGGACNLSFPIYPVPAALTPAETGKRSFYTDSWRSDPS